jgi:hypothetical protein
MPQRGAGERLHVVRRDVVAAGQPGPGPARREQRRGAARGHAQREGRRRPGRAHDVHDVAHDLLADPHPGDGAGARGEVRRPGDRADAGAGEVARVEAAGVAAQHLELDVAGRQGHRQLEQEPVELRLGQRVRALVLDRVLRRGHDERRRQRPRVAVDRHLPLLHGLEQRGLRLGRRPVDLVGEQQVREDRALAERELRRPGVVDERAGDVAGHEVGVNCTRVVSSRSAVESARTSSVFATPGTPSSSTCPRQSSAMTRPVTAASCPTTALPTSARTRDSASRAAAPSGSAARGPWLGVEAGFGHGCCVLPAGLSAWGVVATCVRGCRGRRRAPRGAASPAGADPRRIALHLAVRPPGGLRDQRGDLLRRRARGHREPRRETPQSRRPQRRAAARPREWDWRYSRARPSSVSAARDDDRQRFRDEPAAAPRAPGDREQDGDGELRRHPEHPRRQQVDEARLLLGSDSSSGSGTYQTTRGWAPARGSPEPRRRGRPASGSPAAAPGRRSGRRARRPSWPRTSRRRRRPRPGSRPSPRRTRAGRRARRRGPGRRPARRRRRSPPGAPSPAGSRPAGRSARAGSGRRRPAPRAPAGPAGRA